MWLWPSHLATLTRKSPPARIDSFPPPRRLPGGTELIDPSGSVTDDELGGLLDQIAQYCDAASSPAVGGFALCGTVPPGAAALYAEAAERLKQLDAGAVDDQPILLLDGHKGVDATLQSGRVDVLKINVDEALALTGAATPEQAAAQLLEGESAVLTRPRAVLALTDGAKPARVFGRDGVAYTLHVPEIDVVNAIGAGDVCAAIFLHELVRRRSESSATSSAASATADAAEAFAWGLAAACARCTHELPTAFERQEVEAMRERVRVERVPS